MSVRPTEKLDTVRACVDCKHYEHCDSAYISEKHTCTHPHIYTIDVVLGEKRYQWTPCAEMRSDKMELANGLDSCGRVGNLWEAKT